MSRGDDRARGLPAVQVVITGVGILGSFGVGLRAMAESLQNGAPPLTQLPPSSKLIEQTGWDLPEEERWASLVPTEAWKAWVPAAAARRMSSPSRLAVAAARACLADRDGSETPGSVGSVGSVGSLEQPADAAVYLATGYGPSSVTESLLAAILLQSPQSASPFDFSESVANAPAAQVARLLNARGPNLTLTQRDAGLLTAIRRGAGELRLGRSQEALVGSVDEVTPLLQALFSRFRALAPASAGRPPRPQPFGLERRGFVSAESSAVLVLEREDQAQAAGRTVRAIVEAGGGAFDPTAPTWNWGRDRTLLGDALFEGLDRQGIDLASIDWIVAGAAGSLAGDAVEAAMLKRAWDQAGLPLPGLSAPRGWFGDSPAHQLGAALLLFEDVFPPPSALSYETDPSLGVTLSSKGPVTPPQRVLVTICSPGGAMAWLVLQRPEAASPRSRGA